MAKKITYLFGAGASAGNQSLIYDYSTSSNPNDTIEGIPIVENFNKDIGNFLKVIETHQSASPYNLGGNKNQLAKQFHNEFYPIYQEFKYIFSYDTYAKKLFESKQSEKLNQLKFLLRVYLIYRQSVSQRDKRYDLFFATLIENGKLNPNVNFLSWNYDTQIEFSITSFGKTNQNETDALSEFLSNPPYQIGNNDSLPRLIKLNGSVSYYFENDTFKSGYISNLPQKNVQESVLKILDEYENFKSGKIKNIIEFSWENSEYRLGYNSNLSKILSQTDILIVIGYSFPTLNRKFDKQIFEQLNKPCQIYIQGLPNKVNDVIERASFLLPKRNNINNPPDYPITKIMTVEEFYIPFELE